MSLSKQTDMVMSYNILRWGTEKWDSTLGKVK